MRFTEDKLISYFSGEMKPEELIEIEKWIEQSVENRRIAKEVYAIYQASQTIETIKHTDVDKAFAETKRRIVRRKTTRFVAWIQRTAAILIIPLLLSLVYLITKKEPLQHIEYRTNPGMIAAVELPDGSSVWINSDSWVRCPHKFTGNTREVEIGGEVYFKIKKDKSKKFIVHVSPELSVEALGTEFDVEAYPESMEVITTLISGSVKLSFKNSRNGASEYLLKPDERFSYNTKTKKAALSLPNVPTLTAWKDGHVILKNTPLEETLKILGKRFNVKFIVKNAKLYENSFTYSSDIQHLSLFLEAFKLSSGIQYRFIAPDKQISDSTKGIKTIIELY